jgi:hypothetical protein
MTTRTRNTTSASPVPLAVWPVGEDPSPDQRATHQDPGCIEQPGSIQHTLARRIVEEYSKPRGLVVDLTGGAVLVEAAADRRRAIGVWPDYKLAALASDNLRRALGQRQSALTEFRSGDITVLPEVLEDEVGAADLICLSPAMQPGSEAWWPPATERSCLSTPEIPAKEEAVERAMAAIYAGCFEVLRPGGLLVVISTHFHRDGELVDVAGTTVSQGHRAGFSYLQHVIALRPAIRDGLLDAPAAANRPVSTGGGRQQESSAHQVVHDDVTVLRKPVETEGAHAS